MKKILTSFVALAFYAIGFSQIIWNPSVDVASTSFGSMRPIIRLVNETPVVIWSHPGTDDTYFSKLQSGSFTAPIKLNPSGMNVMTYDWAGPMMDVSGNNIFVVFRDNPWNDGHSYLVKSNDEGDTWSDTIRIDKFDVANQLAYFPSITASSDSNLTAVFMHHPGNDVYPQYARVTSSDGGNTWSDTLELSTKFGAEACDCCPPTIISEGPRQLFIYRNNDANKREFRCLLSNDGGQTFNDSIGIDNGKWTVNSCPSSEASTVFAGDTMLSIYMSAARVFISQSSLVDGSSIYVNDITNSTGTQNYPKIAANDSMTVAVWEGNGNGKDLFMNVFKKDLSDFSKTNAQPIFTETGTQQRPDIAIKDTNIYMVYTDFLSGTVKYMHGVFGYDTITNDTIIDTTGNDTISDTTSFLFAPLKEVKITPNPASDYIQIEIEKLDEVSIYNQLGELVLHSYSKRINVKKLDSGAYTMKIRVKKNFITRQFVRE